MSNVNMRAQNKGVTELIMFGRDVAKWKQIAIL
jgi:hypothetical protein